ncbi:MAG: hypothetical protein J3K34DRAFT_412320 [Monoraphidium minutum]|nr:MAG: hypothetical protein J3K34DRAFT_412320 [Monoraphidium minutum]
MLLAVAAIFRGEPAAAVPLGVPEIVLPDVALPPPPDAPCAWGPQGVDSSAKCASPGASVAMGVASTSMCRLPPIRAPRGGEDSVQLGRRGGIGVCAVIEESLNTPSVQASHRTGPQRAGRAQGLARVGPVGWLLRRTGFEENV